MQKQSITMSYIHSALTYVDKNINSDISLNKIAKYLNIHPCYFSHIFSENTGMTFINYVTLKKWNWLRNI